MSSTKAAKRAKKFTELRKQIDADPARRARVREQKAAMLAELRRELDLTQAVLADRLEVSQENVSQIERGEADVRLSTLSRYVKALGGRLEVRAAFPEQTVALKVGEAAGLRRIRTPASAAQKKVGKPAATRTGKVAAARAGKVATTRTRRVAGARAGKVASARAGKVAASDAATTAQPSARRRHA